MRTLTKTLALTGILTALTVPAATATTDVAVDDPDGDVRVVGTAPSDFEKRRQSYDIHRATLASDGDSVVVTMRIDGLWPAGVPEFNEFRVLLRTHEDIDASEQVWHFADRSDERALQTLHEDRRTNTFETHHDGYCTDAYSTIDMQTLSIVIPRSCIDTGRVYVEWSTYEAFTADRSEGATDFAPGFEAAGPFALAPADARPRPTPRDIATTCDPEQDHGFSDSDGTVHDYSIRCVAGHAIAKGTGDGSTFEPNATLSHGQTATFIRNTLDAAGAPLADSTVDHCGGAAGVHEDNLEALIDAGLIDASYCEVPGVATDRAEMAHWVTGALDHADVPRPADTTDWFSDDDTHPYEPAIDRIASHGIVTGQGDGTYGPGHHLLRGQMATFLARTLDTVRDA